MKITLQHKINFCYAILSVIILIASFYYLEINIAQSTRDTIKDNLIKQLNLSKGIIENELVGKYSEKQPEDISVRLSMELGARVTILDLNGKVLGDSEVTLSGIKSMENHLYRPEIQSAMNTGIGQSKRFSTTLKKDMYYMAIKAGRSDSVFIVRIAIPYSEIDVAINGIKKFLLFLFFITACVMVIIGWGISFYISKPIRNISSAADSIARGNYDIGIPVSSSDEIGLLAKAFNKMTQDIKIKIQSIENNRQRLEAVLLSMFDGVMVVDNKGNILLTNKALEKFFRISSKITEKKPIEIIRNFEIQEIVNKTLRIKHGVESREITILYPEEKTLLINATPIMQSDEIKGAVLVFHDITELRKLENLRKEFVANVSHELRTPVSNIKGYSETLINGAINDKENAKDFLKIIWDSSESLAKLIEDLLDLSKIESGKMELNKSFCSIKNITDTAIKELTKNIKYKNIKINNNVEDAAKVLCDELKMTQVLFNLIDNAVKYNKDGGEIEITSKKEKDSISVSVKDTGIGIPENDLPRIFERFYRVDKARSREMGGTGLGLSIVKHIVQVHGGEVFVQSTLGAGTIFQIKLPAA